MLGCFQLQKFIGKTLEVYISSSKKNSNLSRKRNKNNWVELINNTRFLIYKMWTSGFLSLQQNFVDKNNVWFGGSTNLREPIIQSQFELL